MQSRGIDVLTVENEPRLGGFGAVDDGFLFSISECRPGSGLACRSHVPHRHSANTSMLLLYHKCNTFVAAYRIKTLRSIEDQAFLEHSSEAKEIRKNQ